MKKKPRQLDELRLWAISRMKWDRAIAHERGTRTTSIKGGLKNLNEAVQIILTNREKTPKVRGLAAANAITEVVIESYGKKEEA